MTAWHRRRGGRYASLYPRKLDTDRRGNEQWVPDWDATPKVVSYSGQFDRSSVAEIPGQQVLNYTTIQVPYPIPNVEVYGGVTLSDWPGEQWDISAPVQLHWGTPVVRHYTMILRQRPDHR